MWTPKRKPKKFFQTPEPEPEDKKGKKRAIRLGDMKEEMDPLFQKVALIGFSLIAILVVMIILKQMKTARPDVLPREEINDEVMIQYKSEHRAHNAYKKFMAKGDSVMAINDFQQAAFYYQNASEIYHKKMEPLINMVRAYAESCPENEMHCTKAKNILAKSYTYLNVLGNKKFKAELDSLEKILVLEK